MLTVAGGLVSWKSTLQLTVVLSTIEAEYMAAIEAAKEALWLKELMMELGNQHAEVPLLCDNHSAICLARNQVYHARLNHIALRYHKIWELLNSREIAM